MTNKNNSLQNEIIWIPKKIRAFYYKDIDFNIKNYVLNKNIMDIPKKGYLIKKAINIKKIMLRTRTLKLDNNSFEKGKIILLYVQTIKTKSMTWII